LAQALIDNEKIKSQQDLQKEFPHVSKHDIALAIDDSA
jgi:hypothetical protein